MKKVKAIFIVFFLLNFFVSQAQAPIDSIKFFTDESLIDMTLTTEIRKLQTEKKLNVYQPANVIVRMPDSTVITEDIRLYARGHFRRETCTVPPLMLNFHNPTSPIFNPLGRLKLVIGCGTSGDDEQLILKEYLIYKIYNLLEPKSFRARLIKVNYRDSKNKMKPFSQYAFFIEDDDDMAARNDCFQKEVANVHSESAERTIMTKVAIFEYFISNGDWSVPGNHNIKLIFPKNDDNAKPFVVPYDFDHSGFVNAGYATPNELLGTETVKERVYRGFPRSMEELQATFDIFKSQKENIYSLIMNFTLLKERNRKELVSYLDEFYKTINNKNQVQSIFIDNARRQ